jgi:hypothetical protein
MKLVVDHYNFAESGRAAVPSRHDETNFPTAGDSGKLSVATAAGDSGKLSVATAAGDSGKLSVATAAGDSRPPRLR